LTKKPNSEISSRRNEHSVTIPIISHGKWGYLEVEHEGEIILNLFSIDNPVDQFDFFNKNSNTEFRFNLNVSQIARQFGMEDRELISTLKSLEDAAAWLALSVRRTKIKESIQD